MLPNSTPLNARFSELTLIYQTSLNNTKSTIEKLGKMGKITDESTYKELERRLVTLDTWLNEFAQDRLKFTILQSNPNQIENHWTTELKEVWLDSLDSISDKSTPEEFMASIRNIGQNKNLGPKEIFPPFYQMLTGNSRGPNAANLVFALGKDYLIERINSIKP